MCQLYKWQIKDFDIYYMLFSEAMATFPGHILRILHNGAGLNDVEQRNATYS